MLPVTLTAYLDFWFTDRPIVERVAACAALGLRSVQGWAWRDRPMADLAAECRRLGVTFSDTFDPPAGGLGLRDETPHWFTAWAIRLITPIVLTPGHSLWK